MWHNFASNYVDTANGVITDEGENIDGFDEDDGVEENENMQMEMSKLQPVAN